MGDAGYVGQKPRQLVRFIRRPVPHHIVAALTDPQIVVRAGDRIAETLLARRQTERHRFEQFAMDRRRDRAFGKQRAPGHIAGIKRRDIGRALLAHCRAQSVGADQNIGLHVPPSLKWATTCALLCSNAFRPTAAVIKLWRKRIAQDAIDTLPGGQHLRTFDGRGDSAVVIEDFACGHRQRRGRGCRGRARSRARSIRPARRCRRRGRTSSLSTRSKISTAQPRRSSMMPAKQTAHRAANDQRAAPALPCVNPAISRYFPSRKGFLYCDNNNGRNAMALSMLDKTTDHADKSAWPPAIAAEFEREQQTNNGCVGSTLLSENERVRVWIIRLAPGERIGFHRHVLDYFWTSVSGRTRPPAPARRHHGRIHLPAGRDPPRDLRAGRIQGPRPRESRRQGNGLHDHRVPQQRQ